MDGVSPEYAPTKVKCLKCGMHPLNDLDAFVEHQERYGHWPVTNPEGTK